MKRAGLAVAFAALAASTTCRARREAVPVRNLVLIVVDTLRQDHLQAYGYRRETAPAFSRLAAEGVLWDGVSPTSWTKPAVASILTGLHPIRHQTFGNADALPEAAETLAERLRGHGFGALGITANAWLSRRAGFAQGFTAYNSMLDDLHHGPFSTAQEVNAELLPRLKGLASPFFLYVQYLDPHAPYDPDRDYRGRGLSGRLLARKHGVSIRELQMSRVLVRPPELVEDATDLYDGEIRRTDDAIGELLGELRRLRLDEGTLTVVTSDHGEELQEHGRMGHGQTLYEEVVRVPLLLHAPGTLPAGLRMGTASLLDILPTVLELLSVPFDPGGLDGIGLASFMKTAALPPGSVAGKNAGARELLLHLDLDNDGRDEIMQKGRALALRGDRYKLVLSEVPRRKELFDRGGDPGEQANRLAAAEPALLKTMAEHLAEQYNALAGRSLARAEDLDRDKREAMAALGYVGAGASGPPERGLPPRIQPADRDPEGSLGWPAR
jgi:arylsulfatase A-like enzyme